jgi:hypothetical protein
MTTRTTKASAPLVPFYATRSGRTTLVSNPAVRKICVRVGDAEFMLDVSSISKDYIRKHADGIDELVRWVEAQVEARVKHKHGQELMRAYTETED